MTASAVPQRHDALNTWIVRAAALAAAAFVGYLVGGQVKGGSVSPASLAEGRGIRAAQSPSPSPSPSPSSPQVANGDLLDPNLHYVWIGPIPPPPRVLSAVFGSAALYARHGVGTTRLWMSHNVDGTQAALDAVLATHSCTPQPVITVVPMNLTDLVGDLWHPASIAQLLDLHARASRENSVTVSDVVRAAAVYKYGGVYLDGDTVARVPITRPTIGVDSIGAYNCDGRFPDGYRPLYGNFPAYNLGCMCNGVFAFARGDPLLRAYIQAMPVGLKADVWGIAGPRLFYDTLFMLSNSPDISHVTGVDNVPLLCKPGAAVAECVNVHCGTGGGTDGDLCGDGAAAYQQAIAGCTVVP